MFIGRGGEEDSVICSTQVLLSPGNLNQGNLLHVNDRVAILCLCDINSQENDVG